MAASAPDAGPHPPLLLKVTTVVVAPAVAAAADSWRGVY